MLLLLFATAFIVSMGEVSFTPDYESFAHHLTTRDERPMAAEITEKESGRRVEN